MLRPYYENKLELYLKSRPATKLPPSLPGSNLAPLKFFEFLYLIYF